MEQIINTIKKSKFGLSITDLVRLTNLKRCAVREKLSFLLGAGRIEFRKVGMSKIYMVVEE